MFSPYSASHTVEIIAFNDAADIEWIARLAWPPGDLRPSELVVDARGMIYVLPAVDRESSIDRPVDVLSPDGRHVASAVVRHFLPGHVWQAAVGDHVFGIQPNAQSSEWQVVRNRISHPWIATEGR